MVMCGYVTESCTACFFSFSAFSSVSTHFLRSASDSGMGSPLFGMRILHCRGSRQCRRGIEDEARIAFHCALEEVMGTDLRSSLRFAPPRVEVGRRRDGSILLRSPLELGGHARAVGEWLERGAREKPERTFLAERRDGAWRKLSYREALGLARRAGQGLLDRGLDGSRPVVILSDNSVDHAILALGAMHVGVPVAPISPAYSLLSKDFAKLKAIFELLRPGLVWTADPTKFAPALAAVGARPTPMDELLAEKAGSGVDEAFARVGPGTVAKILFTSGSTGIPKGVINTQRMLTVNQEQYALVWPFLEDRPQVLVDWLPWNHTFGGNNNFGMMLRNGGTFHIDGGKPAPGLIEVTAGNLRDVSPTIYFNVPRGFDLLVPFLEKDAALRRSFFRDLDCMVYAGASLPQNLWERMQQLALAERGARLPLISAWGSTETAPMATRVQLIAAGDPLIQDAVITGHERSEVGALVFLNAAAVRACGLDDTGVREHLCAAMQKLASETGDGSSTHPVRALVMAEPPSIDANEITDKGYINQRAVLERRALLVEKLHAESPASEVIVATP